MRNNFKILNIQLIEIHKVDFKTLIKITYDVLYDSICM